MAYEFPVRWADRMDEATWTTIVPDVSGDAANIDPKVLNGFVAFRMEEYRLGGLIDDELWQWFMEDFEDWTTDIWFKLNGDIIRGFRAFLRRNGVWIPMDNKKIPVNMRLVVERENPYEWEKADFDHQNKHYGGLNPYSRYHRKFTPDATPRSGYPGIALSASRQGPMDPNPEDYYRTSMPPQGFSVPYSTNQVSTTPSTNSEPSSATPTTAISGLPGIT